QPDGHCCTRREVVAARGTEEGVCRSTGPGLGASIFAIGLIRRQAMLPQTHRRVVLARRPPAEPALSDFRIEEVPVPQPGPGQVLVRVVYLSLDPYMRGRMRDAASYAAPVAIGDVMTGGTVGEVVTSNIAGLKI